MDNFASSRRFFTRSYDASRDLNNPNRSGPTDLKRLLTSLRKKWRRQSVMPRYVFVMRVRAIDCEKTDEHVEFYGKSLITAFGKWTAEKRLGAGDVSPNRRFFRSCFNSVG